MPVAEETFGEKTVKHPNTTSEGKDIIMKLLPNFEKRSVCEGGKKEKNCRSLHFQWKCQNSNLSKATILFLNARLAERHLSH